MWQPHSYLEPVMDAEQGVVGEAQHYFSRVRQRPEGYIAANPNAPRIERVALVSGKWQRTVTPVLGQGHGGAIGKAGRTGLVVIGDAVFVTLCDLSAGQTGLINVAISDLDGKFVGEGFGVLNVNVLPPVSGVDWTRLNLCHLAGTYQTVIGLAEGMKDGDWQVFGVTAPQPNGPYTMLNGGAPLSTLRPAGLNGYCSGSITQYPGYFVTHYHAGVTGGLTEVYRSLSLDGITWSSPQRIVSAAEIPLYLGEETTQLADICFCRETGLLSMTQVNSSAKCRVVFLKEAA